MLAETSAGLSRIPRDAGGGPQNKEPKMEIDAHSTSSVTAELVQVKAEARLLLEENGRLRTGLHAIAMAELTDDAGHMPPPSVVWSTAMKMKTIARETLGGQL